MLDKMGRQIEYLRVSVTDRCNLRCVYCMPEGGIEQVTHDEILSFDELYRVIKETTYLGIKKVRITGGEPLVRKGIISFIKKVKEIKGIEEVCLTTNGILLADYMDQLYEAGLDRINISLDTFNCDRYKSITRRDGLDKVLKAIELGVEKGFKRIKVNTVIIKELNYEEIEDFVNLAEEYDIDVRFIELMPIGEAKGYTPTSNDEIKGIIKMHRKLYPVYSKKGSGPAKYYKTNGSKGRIGFISAMSHEFCQECNRIRITPEGFLKLCLHSNKGIDLKELLRNNIDDYELRHIIKDAVENKPDRHHFNENSEDEDNRLMSQIGG
ncbi:GTP 3',8-cyclase MoaA [Anaeromicrobium sediminis]|uniref:GTP 3',8-cyclase n=1 Tax=Anaeromicrobium sediminis TaxID=1478221 RepID=A0A267MBH3_9FIRM|nr:GTP 3',8-cyclase MoaA [Anaeromicrobium sediminis]PAB56807.1 GTP 3',8-cyclase MoaA [Anaeromicrobium sediminis]